MLRTNFNSKEYTFVQMDVILMGRPIGGLRAMEYKVKHQKDKLFGRGKKARSIQHGKKEYEGTLTITQSELIALDRAAQQKGYDDCTDIEFDVIVCYEAGGIVTTDKIIGVSLTEAPRSMKEGDLFMEVALPFIALDVETNLI